MPFKLSESSLVSIQTIIEKVYAGHTKPDRLIQTMESCSTKTKQSIKSDSATDGNCSEDDDFAIESSDSDYVDIDDPTLLQDTVVKQLLIILDEYAAQRLNNLSLLDELLHAFYTQDQQQAVAMIVSNMVNAQMHLEKDFSVKFMRLDIMKQPNAYILAQAWAATTPSNIAFLVMNFFNSCIPNGYDSACSIIDVFLHSLLFSPQDQETRISNLALLLDTLYASMNPVSLEQQLFRYIIHKLRDMNLSEVESALDVSRKYGCSVTMGIVKAQSSMLFSKTYIAQFHLPSRNDLSHAVAKIATYKPKIT